MKRKHHKNPVIFMFVVAIVLLTFKISNGQTANTYGGGYGTG